MRGRSLRARARLMSLRLAGLQCFVKGRAWGLSVRLISVWRSNHASVWSPESYLTTLFQHTWCLLSLFFSQPRFIGMTVKFCQSIIFTVLKYRCMKQEKLQYSLCIIWKNSLNAMKNKCVRGVQRWRNPKKYLDT